ncbi:unnamed protein product [Cylicocyclus nassatus]|uniref:G protein-coupled receptor n=1 Tax=Cylicocyclus nassatus TaxID=53992 RepID=A0AA36MAW6_CYLNA|nr:unnamed protein product [Cylicocyclus nassatus]
MSGVELTTQRQQVAEFDEEIRLAQINCLCAAAMSIVMNVAVLFITRKLRGSYNLMSSAPIITYTSCTAIAFSVTHALSCPVTEIGRHEISWFLLHSAINFPSVDNNHEHPLRGRPAIYSARESALLRPLLTVLVVLLLCAFVCMMYSAKCISSRIAIMTDENSKKRHTRIFRLLLMQTSLPFLFLHLPILISFSLEKWLPEIISDNIAVVYAWYPALVPIMVYWNVKDRFTKCCCSRRRRSKTTQITTHRSTLQS